MQNIGPVLHLFLTGNCAIYNVLLNKSKKQPPCGIQSIFDLSKCKIFKLIYLRAPLKNHCPNPARSVFRHSSQKFLTDGYESVCGIFV